MGRLAWLAIVNIVKSHDSEPIVHVWGQLEVSCGLSARHLCQVMPGTTVMKSIFILNEELWKKRRQTKNNRFGPLRIFRYSDTQWQTMYRLQKPADHVILNDVIGLFCYLGDNL